MPQARRSFQEVLKDKSGLSTSIVETLAGMGLKGLSLSMSGGLLATMLIFWAVNTSSAETSSSYQTASVAFEKAVKESSVVVGGADNRIGLLSDTSDGNCKVQTWQAGARDGHPTLNVDTKTVPGVCKATTPLLALGSGDMSQELAYNVDTPSFTYSNLGGRAITFDAAGTATLATGTMPAGVKLADWNDVRPYSVKLNLSTLDTNTAQVTKKAELSGVTNVVNVSIAQNDQLRYVPAPSTDPVPGPLRITGTNRSTTVGTIYSGAREGVTVMVTGGVCASGPTKLTVSYTMQSPLTAPPVTTVVSIALTGNAVPVDLGSTPNGSSGAVDVTATCIDGGVAEKSSSGYTQLVPAPVLTATQGSPAETHNLSWTQVSSLPVSYHLSMTSTNGRSGSLDLPGLSTPFNQQLGTVYGFTSTYKVNATVGSVTSPDSASASITNNWPAVGKPTVYNDGGWTYGNKDTVRWYWTAVSCPAGTDTQYSTSWWRSDVGSSAWSGMISWTFYDLSTWTQGYDYSVDVAARCISSVTGNASGFVFSNGPPFTRNVENPAPIRFDMWQNGTRELITNPYTYCTGGASLYEWIVEASWDVIWIGGPRNGNTGWYVNQPGWYDWGWGVVTSHITSPWNFPRGARFTVRAAAQCKAPTGRASGVIQQDSPLWSWW